MKRIDSTISRWPGYVVTPDYLGFPSLTKWNAAVNIAKKIEDDVAAFYEAMLPVVLTIIQEWHIAGIPEHPTLDEVPASLEMAGWLTKIVIGMFQDANGIDPNSSVP